MSIIHASSVVGAKSKVLSTDVIVSVTTLKTIFDTASVGGESAYAYVGVHADGDLYESKTGTSPNVAYETWLDEGTNNQVWVECTFTGDTIDSGCSATGSRLACTSDRKWGITASAGTFKTSTAVLDFYDDAVSGNLLDSQTVLLTADASET